MNQQQIISDILKGDTGMSEPEQPIQVAGLEMLPKIVQMVKALKNKGADVVWRGSHEAKPAFSEQANFYSNNPTMASTYALPEMYGDDLLLNKGSNVDAFTINNPKRVKSVTPVNNLSSFETMAISPADARRLQLVTKEQARALKDAGNNVSVNTDQLAGHLPDLPRWDGIRLKNIIDHGDLNPFFTEQQHLKNTYREPPDVLEHLNQNKYLPREWHPKLNNSGYAVDPIMGDSVILKPSAVTKVKP